MDSWRPLVVLTGRLTAAALPDDVEPASGTSQGSGSFQGAPVMSQAVQRSDLMSQTLALMQAVLLGHCQVIL